MPIYCLANIFKNFLLWDYNYGYAKAYPALFPLNDAPYTAAYEEQEVFAALHNLLMYAKDVDILPSVSMLVSEFLKHFLNCAPYYYPPNLPKEMLSNEVETGQWIITYGLLLRTFTTAGKVRYRGTESV